MNLAGNPVAKSSGRRPNRTAEEPPMMGKTARTSAGTPGARLVWVAACPMMASGSTGAALNDLPNKKAGLA
jgi:hypothetical protein